MKFEYVVKGNGKGEPKDGDKYILPRRLISSKLKKPFKKGKRICLFMEDRKKPGENSPELIPSTPPRFERDSSNSEKRTFELFFVMCSR